MSRLHYSQHAWAVKITHQNRIFLAGRFYFFWHKKVEPPHAGCRIALFETRKIARQYAAKARELFTYHVTYHRTRASVVKVYLEITEGET